MDGWMDGEREGGREGGRGKTERERVEKCEEKEKQ